MEADRKKIRLVAMDLDGTLTQHKSRMDPLCRSALDRLSERYRLLMVCAGGCLRVFRQMEAFPVDILGFYGMQWSSAAGGVFSILKNRVVPADRPAVEEKAARLRKELRLPACRGDAVEFHDSGVITLPMLGTAAPLAEKLAFDPDRSLRRAVYGRVSEIFDDYTVFIGGSSSFDLAPPPYRKLYALSEYLSEQGIGAGETVYFGDDYGLGGNDADICHSGIPFFAIDDYRDFPKRAAELLH